MNVPFAVPDSAYPLKDPAHPCPCQFKLYEIEEKPVLIFWKKQAGDHVEKDEIICAGEVEKKTLEFHSPAGGVLAKIFVNDGEKASVGTVLGEIETDEADL